MNKLILSFVLLASVSCISGQYLKNKKVKATKPIDQACLALTNSDSIEDNCNFWKCFEERFPCGSEFWITNWGYKYCSRYADPTFSGSFTPSGQKLLTHVNSCLPKSMKRAYKRGFQNCKRLQQEAFRAQGKCYARVQKLFCKAFPENSDKFTAVLDQSDFFNMDSVRMIKDTADRCEPKIDLAKLMFPDGNAPQ